MPLVDNLAQIRKILGTKPVRIIAVSKYVSAALIEDAFQYGITEFGESRVQDALHKRSQVSDSINNKIHWHFIGHLQSNKVKQVVGNFTLIHSIDSLHLCEEVSRISLERGLIQPLLLQVKMLKDDNKFGFDPEQLREEFTKLSALGGIKIMGLMTMAPLSADAATGHICFSALRSFRDEMEQKFSIKLQELSMGTSQDWQEAVKCGATMVRLGQAIFGTR
jgi:pyridoxal phosphate enzyme (YggS family)